MSSVLQVKGVRFGMTFYFVCPENHVHVVECGFKGLEMESLNEESISAARDVVLKASGHGFRIATEAEIDAFEKQRGAHAPDELAEEISRPSVETMKDKKGRMVFVLPEAKDPQ